MQLFIFIIVMLLERIVLHIVYCPDIHFRIIVHQYSAKVSREDQIQFKPHAWIVIPSMGFSLEIVKLLILTREPAESIAFIHNRMPVILPSEAKVDWLNVRYKAGGSIEES